MTWIIAQHDLGYPLTHQEIRLFVERILERSGDDSRVGKRWVQRFLKRNPVIKVGRSRGIDVQRINGASTENIKAWWPYVKNPTVAAIDDDNTWNGDEAGIMEGQGFNSLVLGSLEKSIIRKK